MVTDKKQDLSNHTRFDPAFHFFAVPLMVLNVIACIVHLVRHHDWFAAWGVVMSLVLLVVVFLVRIYPLKVQDRVIRLEERLRLGGLLPESARPQIARLTERQLVALRFAGDGEVAALAIEAAEQNLSPAEIKKRIRDWRADYWRV